MPEWGGTGLAKPTLPFKNTLIFIIFSPFALNFLVGPTQNDALLIWFWRPCPWVYSYGAIHLICCNDNKQKNITRLSSVYGLWRVEKCMLHEYKAKRKRCDIKHVNSMEERKEEPCKTFVQITNF